MKSDETEKLHKEVEDEKGGHDEEGDKVGVGEIRTAALGVAGLVAVGVALDGGLLDAGHHDLLPDLACHVYGLSQHIRFVITAVHIRIFFRKTYDLYPK